MNGMLAEIAGWAAAVVIPMIVTSVVAETVEAIKPREYHAVPALRRTALLAGVLLAAAMFWAGPPGSVYAIDLIFAADGPWNVDFPTMLAERFAPYAGLLPDVYLRSWDAPLWVRVVLSLHAILLLLTLLLPFRLWDGPDAVRAAICDALILVAAAFMPLYVACAAYWLMNELNIWVVALAGLVFQRYRQQRYHYSAGHG